MLHHHRLENRRYTVTNTRVGSRIDEDFDRKIMQRLHDERLSEGVQNRYFLGSERHDRMFSALGIHDGSAHAVARSNVRGDTKGRYTERSDRNCPDCHALNIIEESEPCISRHFVATQQSCSGKTDLMEISERVIDRSGATPLRKESVQTSLVSDSMIELNRYIPADNTSAHDAAVMNGNEKGLNSSILLAIDGACKDDSDARISNGCRRRHIPVHHLRDHIKIR